MKYFLLIFSNLLSTQAFSDLHIHTRLNDLTPSNYILIDKDMKVPSKSGETLYIYDGRILTESLIDSAGRKLEHKEWNSICKLSLLPEKKLNHLKKGQVIWVSTKKSQHELVLDHYSIRGISCSGKKEQYKNHVGVIRYLNRASKGKLKIK